MLLLKIESIPRKRQVLIFYGAASIRHPRTRRDSGPRMRALCKPRGAWGTGHAIPRWSKWHTIRWQLHQSLWGHTLIKSGSATENTVWTVGQADILGVKISWTLMIPVHQNSCTCQSEDIATKISKVIVLIGDRVLAKCYAGYTRDEGTDSKDVPQNTESWKVSRREHQNPPTSSI